MYEPGVPEMTTLAQLQSLFWTPVETLLRTISDVAGLLMSPKVVRLSWRVGLELAAVAWISNMGLSAPLETWYTASAESLELPLPSLYST